MILLNTLVMAAATVPGDRSKILAILLGGGVMACFIIIGILDAIFGILNDPVPKQQEKENAR